MRWTGLLCFLLFARPTFAQDTIYARKVIKYLASETCFGRGYLKNGLGKAETFLIGELREQSVAGLFDGSYTQPFFHPVNTFTRKCHVVVNGKKLKAGVDYIPDPASASAKGRFVLTKADSTHYVSARPGKISVVIKNKLTFSVSGEAAPLCTIQLDKNRFTEEPREIEIKLFNKQVAAFKSNNIGCYINGQTTSDSVVVFSAHYDHLGGIGRSVFFPGANDNASGVSVLLNLVRFYKAHPPKYKTIFIFFAGEEAGLLGSRFFTGHTPVDLKKIKFLINLDLLGTGDDGIMVVNGAVHEKEFAALARLNKERHLVKEVRKRGKAANSDHYWFSEAGVPCFFIYTLGGIKAYHDVFDIEKTLPLTDYVDVFHLVTAFIGQL